MESTNTTPRYILGIIIKAWAGLSVVFCIAGPIQRMDLVGILLEAAGLLSFWLSAKAIGWAESKGMFILPSSTGCQNYRNNNASKVMACRCPSSEAQIEALNTGASSVDVDAVMFR